jgi:hypothetical protein
LGIKTEELNSFNRPSKRKLVLDGMLVKDRQRIADNNETAYREEVSDLAVCQENNISIKISKTKALIVDYRNGGQSTHPHTSTGLQWSR